MYLPLSPSPIQIGGAQDDDEACDDADTVGNEIRGKGAASYVKHGKAQGEENHADCDLSQARSLSNKQRPFKPFSLDHAADEGGDPDGEEDPNG